MSKRFSIIIGLLASALLASCGAPVGGAEATPQATPVGEEATQPREPTPAPDFVEPSPEPAEPTPSDAGEEATPVPAEPSPTEATGGQATSAPEPSAAPDGPTNTPVEAIATLVAVQVGTFPEGTDANGNTVAWNNVVLTESIPNAGFFIADGPEGAQLLNLDCQIIFDGQTVYKRQGQVGDLDLTLFGQGFSQNSYLFADADFQWPDFDGDGTAAPIVSGEYTLVVRGETSAGPVQQSFPFTIDLDAAENATPTPVS